MSTPPRRIKIGNGMIGFLLVLLVVLLPVTLTMSRVRHPQSMVSPDGNPTPFGYSVSLLLFLVPALAIALWFLTHPTLRLRRKAFLRTIGILAPVGVGLDVLFASQFFTFVNRQAVMGIWVPVRGGSVPVEEFLFYILGFIAILLTYIWCDEQWLAAYKATDYEERAQAVPRLVQLHWPALAAGAFLAALGVAYRWFVVGESGWPSYYLFLILLAVTPCFLLYRTAAPTINGRAFSFTFFLILLVSLIWEATLAVPYQWWGYQPQAMMGLYVDAWSRLPIEAVILWVAVSFATVVWYESVKVFLSMEQRFFKALFGPAPASATPSPEKLKQTAPVSPADIR